MKATTICALAIAALVLGAAVLTPSGAETARPGRPLRIAVCDFGEVYNNYEKAKSLEQKLKARLANIQAEDKAQKEKLRQKQEETNRLMTRSSEYEKQLKELQKLTSQHMVWMQMQKAQSQRWHLLMTTDMFNEITKVVRDMSKEKGYDIVLQTHQLNLKSKNAQELFQKITLQQVLYHESHVDITEAVLRSVNAAYRASAE